MSEVLIYLWHCPDCDVYWGPDSDVTESGRSSCPDCSHDLQWVLADFVQRQPGAVLPDLTSTAHHLPAPLDAHDGMWRCSCGEVFRSSAGFVICPSRP